MQLISTFLSAGISGFESPANEFIDLPMSLDDLLINHPSATFMGKASGSSMIGFGIFDGDVLLIDRAAAKTNFDIVAATLNNQFVCKGFDRKANKLISASPERTEYALSEADEYQEEGIVISSIRLHRLSTKISACLR